MCVNKGGDMDVGMWVDVHGNGCVDVCVDVCVAVVLDVCLDVVWRCVCRRV